MPTERLCWPANAITWIMHSPLCSNIINWCVNTHRSNHPPLQHGTKLLFMWLRSCGETISHIRMLKLIDRDAGDWEGEQRELFVTSFHLTGIIRYMKLKFLAGGSCWQHYFLFHSSLLFFCAPVYANLEPVFFPWPLKAASSPALWLHSLHSRAQHTEQPVSVFTPLLPEIERYHRGIHYFSLLS